MSIKITRFFFMGLIVFNSGWVSASLPGVEENNCTDLNQFEWLLGDWQANQGKTLLTESWVMTNENIMHARGVTDSNKKDSKLFVEHLSIQKIGDNIFYIAKPPQNEFPTAFKLTQCSSQSMRFENITHDFPQIIEYQISSDGHLKAKVSSLTNKGFEIDFTKVGAKKLTNKQIIVEYVDAYNQKSLTQMMVHVSDSVRWMSLNDSTVAIETKSRQELEVALKAHFGRATKSISSLSGLVEVDRFVSAVEKVTSLRDGKVSNICSLSVYEFSEKTEEQQLIKNVWYYSAVKC